MKKNLSLITGILSLLLITSYSEALEVTAGVIRSAVRDNNGVLVKDGIRYKVDDFLDSLPEISDDCLVYFWSMSSIPSDDLKCMIDVPPTIDPETGEEIAYGLPGIFRCSLTILGPESSHSADISDKTSSVSSQVVNQKDDSHVSEHSIEKGKDYTLRSSDHHD
jgi:hypothetical protein